MKQSLISNWKMKRIADGAVYETAVPGSVLQTLQENGVIPEKK